MTHTAGELAQYLGARLEGDAGAKISSVASPERARDEDLIYIESPRHRDRAAAFSCHVCTRAADDAVGGEDDSRNESAEAHICKSSRMAAADACRTGGDPFDCGRGGERQARGRYRRRAVCGDRRRCGNRRRDTIEAFCFLGRGSRVGQSCLLHPRVTLYAGSRLGDRVEIHSGAVIGGDGFGYVFGEGRHWKFPQIGSVEIGDDVEIGSNTTIDRGSLEITRIGNGVKIDNLVQVAHNVQIGEHSVLASQVGISGSSTLGKHVLVGGQAGMGDHCKIEDGAIIGGQAGILPHKTIRPGQIVWGTPARPLEKFKEQFAWTARLPELAERVRKLAKDSEDS